MIYRSLNALTFEAFMANEPFGTWFRRKRGKITLASIAEKINSTPTTISRYETGKRQTPYDVALQLADAIGVPREEAKQAWTAAYGGDALFSSLAELARQRDPNLARLIENFEGMNAGKKQILVNMSDVLAEGPDIYDPNVDVKEQEYLEQLEREKATTKN